MSERSAWVVSADDEFIQTYLASLGRQSAGEAVGFYPTQLLGKTWGKTRPQLVIVDLRDDENWEPLDELHKRYCELEGAPTPFVGIVDRGVPLARALQADRLLAAIHSTSLPADEVVERLPIAAETERAKRQVRAAGCRTLPAGGRCYTTYTPALFDVYAKLPIAAQRGFTILLIGETGTGKTTFAKLIHQLSPRREGRYVNVACGALPHELLGSELFGHIRGAFTGADREKQGKFDIADGGTLLLDEVDVLGMEQQANLLRVIETGEFEPVGSNDTHRVNVRVVAASNQSLETAIAEGRFRSDLFYRLKQVSFEIPPLRRRRADIVPLAIDAMVECLEEHPLPVDAIDPEYLELLIHYDWPGNIRELRNEVRNALMFSRDGVVTPDLLSPAVYDVACARRAASLEAGCEAVLAGEVAQTECEAIEEMLRLHDFNRTAAARALGISRVTLYNKIRKYRIDLQGGGGGLRRRRG